MNRNQKIELLAKYQGISMEEEVSFSPDTDWNHLMPVCKKIIES